MCRREKENLSRIERFVPLVVGEVALWAVSRLHVLIPLGVGLVVRLGFEPVIQSLCRFEFPSSLLPFGRSVALLSIEVDFTDSSLLL